MDKVAVLVPCFKRAEYTEICLESLQKNTTYENVTFFLIDDASHDKTLRFMENFKKTKRIFSHIENKGLREIIIDFFDMTKYYDYICKVDNDCAVPEHWIEDLLRIYKEGKYDVISPNVFPSNAAETANYTIGGLWFMRRSFINGMYFERVACGGIKGAHLLIQQIITEKDPKFGWITDVVFQDIGHWSGKHEKHIKSDEHREYSHLIGRDIAW
jgi:glycosyltransferase involved in cell wall biosynthesis